MSFYDCSDCGKYHPCRRHGGELPGDPCDDSAIEALHAQIKAAKENRNYEEVRRLEEKLAKAEESYKFHAGY